MEKSAAVNSVLLGRAPFLHPLYACGGQLAARLTPHFIQQNHAGTDTAVKSLLFILGVNQYRNTHPRPRGPERKLTSISYTRAYVLKSPG